MRLGRKNLWYSLALAGVMLLFLAGYFICMLPSLYVDYVMEQNLRSVRVQHRAYMERGSYEGIAVRNSAACVSLELPAQGDYVLVAGKRFLAEVRLRDVRLLQALDRCRERLFAAEDAGREEMAEGLEAELAALGEILREAVQADVSLPVSLRLRYLGDEEEYFNESVKIHTYSDGVFVIETSVEDSCSRYANYIAAERTGERLVLSFLPAVAPDVDEIRPVVLRSLPMLTAVILFLVLLSSGLYSNGIVRPIVGLVRHAEAMKRSRDFSVGRFSQEGSCGGEVGELADTLDDLYQQIKETCLQLEEKNRELAEENERQEVFLRASSHQLKTPIAAALLLVEGMANGVGRYRETGIYLPKVKEQLLSMRRMVEDILYLNRCAEDMRLLRTDVGRVLERRLQSYQVPMADRQISVEFPEEISFFADTDEGMLVQILDNLLSNAVRYTPVGGRIRISPREGEQGRGIRIENFGVTIPEELAPHIFEPFVSGRHGAEGFGTQSHGLGLYIVAYYARKLGILLSVRNGADWVAAELMFTRGSDETGSREVIQPQR